MKLVAKVVQQSLTCWEAWLTDGTLLGAGNTQHAAKLLVERHINPRKARRIAAGESLPWSLRWAAVAHDRSFTGRGRVRVGVCGRAACPCHIREEGAA